MTHSLRPFSSRRRAPVRAPAAGLRLSRRSALAGMALAAAGAALPRPSRAGTLDASQVKETVFPNGLRLLVKPARATELASIQTWIRVGGFLEDEKTSGTAHAIEHLLFRADSRGSSAIDDEIENLGGLLEATTEKDWTRLTCTVSGRYAGKVVGLIADTLRKPVFRLPDLEGEKPILGEEIMSIGNNPSALVASLVYDLAFKTHPYKRDVRGTPTFLNQLKLDSVRSYYQKYYVPANMIVVVVGDVDPAGMERATRAAFQADTPAPALNLPLAPDERACAEPVRRVLPSPFGIGLVGLAFPAPSVKEEPDTHAMDVLLTMLEQGGQGRLPRLLKGMPVEATYETRRQPGLFMVVAATGGNDPETVEQLLRKELDFLATNPVPGAELDYAKRALHGSFALDNEPYEGQAGTLGYYAAIDRWQFAAEYLPKVDAVTAEQVQATAKKYLQAEHSVAVLLRPRTGPNNTPPRTGA